MTLFPRSLEEWYKPFTKEEKTWFILAFIVAIILAATTVGWFLIDPYHQVPIESYAISPSMFDKLATTFANLYKDKIIPEDVDVYIVAHQFYFTPSKIILKKVLLIEFIFLAQMYFMGLA
jgi:hypothetical protein